MSKSDYFEKYKDPRWQKKRLEILERDEWKCWSCGDDKTMLHVHHISYDYGKDPWDYDNDRLVTLCAKCHDLEHDCKENIGEYIKVLNRKKNFTFTDIAKLLAYLNESVENRMDIKFSWLPILAGDKEYIHMGSEFHEAFFDKYPEGSLGDKFTETYMKEFREHVIKTYSDN